MADLIQLRRGTAAEWSASNPVLASGEIGIELDTLKMKCGDGINNWSALSYWNAGAEPALGNPAEDGLALVSTADGVRSWAEAGGGNNLVLIGHSNSYLCTSETDYSPLLDMRFIQDSMRNKKILKIAIVEKGNGNCKVTVTDGTTSVNVVGANGNFASYVVRELKLDCSTLTTGLLWTVTVEGQAVSGEYEIRRFSCQADPAYNLGCYPLILSDPGVSHNTATSTIVDTKYFPVNWAIDNQCIVHSQGLLTLNSGTTATVRVRLTTSMGVDTTFEELSQTVTATGYFDLLISFPSIVAPFVRVDVYLSTDGMVTLEHFECWLEV